MTVARSPRRYAVRGLPGATYLCFRVVELDGRELLSLIPDSENQHTMDVATVFLDDPDLYEVDPVTGEPLGAEALVDEVA